MYYVYKVEFQQYSAVYIGCTNNLRRRKDQHNGNAVTGKSFFGRFLKSIGVKLKESNLQIIGEFADRPQALRYERETTLSLNGAGLLVLNEVYSDHWKHAGMKGAGNPAHKAYYVVDMQAQTVDMTEDMHAWSAEHKCSYKSLIGTAKRKPLVHQRRFIARLADEWEALSEQQRKSLVNGEWYANHLAASTDAGRTRKARTYLVERPDGSTEVVCNLCAYARAHNVNEGNLHASASSGKSAAGYRVLQRIA